MFPQAYPPFSGRVLGDAGKNHAEEHTTVSTLDNCRPEFQSESAPLFTSTDIAKGPD